jgi:hypothetical protein
MSGTNSQTMQCHTPEYWYLDVPLALSMWNTVSAFIRDVSLHYWVIGSQYFGMMQCSQDVGNQLPSNAVSYPTRAEISTVPLQKPKNLHNIARFILKNVGVKLVLLYLWLVTVEKLGYSKVTILRPCKEVLWVALRDSSLSLYPM